MSDMTKTYKRASDKRNTAIKVEKGKRGKGKKKDAFLSPDLNMFSQGLGHTTGAYVVHGRITS